MKKLKESTEKMIIIGSKKFDKFCMVDSLTTISNNYNKCYFFIYFCWVIWYNISKKIEEFLCQNSNQASQEIK